MVLKAADNNDEGMRLMKWAEVVLDFELIWAHLLPTSFRFMIQN